MPRARRARAPRARGPRTRRGLIDGSASAHPGNRVLLVEEIVRDDGPGIPSDALPHVFERFFRVDPSRTRATGGRGLGLAIARETVEAHGGTLTVESGTGSTTFTIRLPGVGSGA